MITELGIVWRRVRFDTDEVHGGSFAEYACDEHPRLTRIVQRQNTDAEYVETFHVSGLVQYYHTPGEALDAMRANP